jgi:FtsZ-interacting cell division protein ZipA
MPRWMYPIDYPLDQNLWVFGFELIVGFLALAVILFVGFWFLHKIIQELRVKLSLVEEKINKIEKDLNELLEQLREI